METPGGIPDFNTLKNLYQKNPTAYEVLRQQILNDAIKAAPPSQRLALERTLDRIEVARQATATPMEAVVEASRMMHESWGKLPEAWLCLRQEMAALQTIIVLEKVKRPRP